jgi:hypothetical protein
MTAPRRDKPSSQRDAGDEKRSRRPPARSMHEGITECDDPICCCEPEPRWQALAEEMERERTARE